MLSIGKSSKHLYYISSVFLVIFTAYFGVKSMLKSIYKHIGYSQLGSLSLLVSSISFGVGSFFAKTIVNKNGYRFSMMFGASLFLCGYSSSLLMSACDLKDSPSYCDSTVFVYGSNCILFSLLGFGNSLLWNAQGGYINSISSESKRGQNFGIFNTFYKLSTILAGALPSVILYISSLQSYYITMLLLGLLSIGLLYFVQEDQPEMIEEPLSARTSMKNSFKKVIAASLEVEFRPWIYFMVLLGFTQTMTFGYLHTFVEASLPAATPRASLESYIAQMFIFYGIGEFSCPYLVGRSIDKYSPRKIATTIVSLYIALALLGYLGIFAKRYWIACVMALLCGCGDSSIQTLIQSIVSKNFGGRLEYFGLNRVVSCLTSSMGFLFMFIFDSISNVYFFSIFAVYLLYVAYQVYKFNTNTIECNTVELKILA
eukprot:TRINITY_DN11520_c0_g1_i1.p1 TRINITY_DN11520_c0_g1~~TRINITY_DN11520_c0_g1_i1.p1  ORF type:complete len:428 (-),score=77.34 TRINITY_DN11520_c0_g1_i1:54-1337(-)